MVETVTPDAKSAVAAAARFTSFPIPLTNFLPAAADSKRRRLIVECAFLMNDLFAAAAGEVDIWTPKTTVGRH